MKKIIVLLAFSNIAFTQNIKSTKDVEKVLDKLHLYAAEANAKKYIDLLITNCKFNTNKFACLNLYIPLTINIKSQLRIITNKIPR